MKDDIEYISTQSFFSPKLYVTLSDINTIKGMREDKEQGERIQEQIILLKNKENNNLLTDTLELHFVEIPKMKEINQDDMLSLWTAFLDDPNNHKLVELEARYEELHEAKIELARLSRDPKEAEIYRMREDAINERKISVKDIDLFAITNGPGSFTGVRIGISCVKGMADALGKQCVAVSTLEAIAEPLKNEDVIACAVMDARCNQVYTASFRVDGSSVTRLTDDEAIKIDELKQRLPSYENVVFVGDGARICHNALGYSIAPPSLLYQKGSSVALCAEKNYSKEKLLDGAALVPVYLRLPQAERELNNKNSLKKENIK